MSVVRLLKMQEGRVLEGYYLSRGRLVRPIKSPDLLGFLDGMFSKGMV